MRKTTNKKKKRRKREKELENKKRKLIKRKKRRLKSKRKGSSKNIGYKKDQEEMVKLNVGGKQLVACKRVVKTTLNLMAKLFLENSPLSPLKDIVFLDREYLSNLYIL